VLNFHHNALASEIEFLKVEIDRNWFLLGQGYDKLEEKRVAMKQFVTDEETEDLAKEEIKTLRAAQGCDFIVK